MKIKFEYDWDWTLFSTPSIEMGNIFGYFFIMVRIAWFWWSVDFYKNDEDIEK